MTGRPAETYRAARRNGCRQGHEVWSPEWYFQGSRYASKHEAVYRRHTRLSGPVSKYHPLRWLRAAWMHVKAERAAARAGR